MEKIIIQNNRALFTYIGESLDLMNVPDSSNDDFYSLYNNLINNTLAIYSTSRSDGSIPVFWTKLENNERLSRSPDQSSTLRKLDNGKSYYILVDNSSSFPLIIPTPVNFDKLSVCDCTYSSQDISCCEQISVSGQYSNIDLSGTYIKNISIGLSGLKPNLKYYYELEPILSNWPAKIYPLSGFIERNAPSDKKNSIKANLELTFSYISLNDSGNINNNLNNQDTKNIYSVIDMSIYQEDCESRIFKDTITVNCRDCLGILASGTKTCPEIKFVQDPIIMTNTTEEIVLSYNKIDVSKDNYFFISSYASNWPSRISDTSGLIIPEYIYTDIDDGKLYGSGNISLGFSFSETSIPFSPNWSNLDYVLDSNYQEKFIKDNIYNSLYATITTPSGCVSGISSTTIICDDCLPQNEYSCINQSKIDIFLTDTTYPNHLTTNSRAGAEISIPIECCDQDRHVMVDITGVCPNEIYDYYFSIEPNTNYLSPISGFFSFPSGVGSIGALVNIDNNEAINFQCKISHRDTQKSISDSIILRCSYCEWSNKKEITELYIDKFHNSVSSCVHSNFDGSTIIATIPSGHIYRSTDKGINWNRLDQHGEKPWSSVNYTEAGGDGMWLFSTGDSLNTPVITGTVYLSTDNADTLIELPVPSAGYNHIESTSDASMILVSYGTGMLRSTDTGVTWDSISSQEIFGSTQGRLAINMSIADTLISPIYSQIVISIPSTSGAYMQSLDYGTTWENKTLPFINASSSLIKYSKDGSTLVALRRINLPSSSGYIYISSDDGDSWFPKRFVTGVYPGVENFYLSETGATIALLGFNKIYKTKDYGDNWVEYQMPSGYNNTNITKILSMGHSSDMSIMATACRDTSTYALQLYNCPAERIE